MHAIQLGFQTVNVNVSNVRRLDLSAVQRSAALGSLGSLRLGGFRATASASVSVPVGGQRRSSAGQPVALWRPEAALPFSNVKRAPRIPRSLSLDIGGRSCPSLALS
eukprot:11651825-Alexandrium_andersonii.AAC.1